MTSLDMSIPLIFFFIPWIIYSLCVKDENLAVLYPPSFPYNIHLFYIFPIELCCSF